MSSLTFKQHTFFSMQRLTEMAETGAEHTGHEIIEIYLVLNGKVTVAGKELQVLLANNDLYCTCRNGYSMAETEAGTEGYVIRFNKDLLYSGDQEFYCPHFPAFHALVLRDEVIKLDASFLSEGKKICDMMYQELTCHTDFSMQILSGFLDIFLLHLIRRLNVFMHVTGNEGQHMLARKFKALLEQNFKTSRKVSDYAALLCVTPSHLNAIIKQATGKSVSSLIRQRVAGEAVRQAKLTGASMKEVAYSLGFDDNAHFSKFFKKAAGKSFSDIKKYSCKKQWVLEMAV